MSEEGKQRELTIKQRKWMKIYLECGNATEAAMQVYDCSDRGAAANIGYENVRKLDYEDFMEAAGITDVLLQQRLLEGINAVDIHKETKKAKKAKKGEEQEEAEIVEVEIPNKVVRHKYLETALKLKKRLIDRKDITSKGKAILGAKEMTDKLDEILNEPEDDIEEKESDKSDG
ncbi:unnamed protein product [marine sediment metagenome]|uniref:Terminase small subunit n=1 Tax=marine sediment metagenome TaxID=412755 RepID=X0T394_9ZZZZ